MKSEDFIRAVGGIEIPDGARERVLRRVRSTGRKEHTIMGKKKILALTAAVVMVIGAAAYAANSYISSWHSSSSAYDAYKTLPTEQQCTEDCGFVPTLIDSFENGYAFEGGRVVKNDLRDDAEKSVEKFNSFSFDYAKDGDKVYFSQEKYNSMTDEPSVKIGEENGVDIYYYSYRNKFVPADYKLTEEDKRAEQAGELIFSYGSSGVEVMTVSSVSWQKDGVHCSLMQLGGALSQEELVQMAREAINA